jgi:very-short-patch-repair endonuclease
MSYNIEYYYNNKEKIAKQRRINKNYKEQKLVICRICNENIGIKGISLHTKRLHNIDFKTYLISNIEDFKEYGWKLCPECNTNYTKKDTCSVECSAKIKSKKYKGRVPWNVGKSTTKTTRNKISEALRDRPGKKHTEETKQKLSDMAKQRVLHPDYINPMKGKTHTEQALRKIFDKRSLTKPELKVQQILEMEGYKIRPQWFLHDMNGNTYSYDFCLEDYNILIEVDGDYWHGGPGVKNSWYGVAETKMKDSIKDHVAISNGYKILRIWESEINNNTETIINKVREVL